MNKVLLVVIIFSTATTALGADTFCTPQENIIFSCITVTKVVSVCASKDLSPTRGYIQYRFGRMGKVEFTVPKTKNGMPPNLKLTAGKDDISDYNDFSFVHGSYRYSITSNRLVKEFRSGYQTLSESDGITVEDTKKSLRDGSIIFTEDCRRDTKPFNAKALSELLGISVEKAGI